MQIPHLLQNNSDKWEDRVDIGGRQHQLTTLLKQSLFGCFQPTVEFAPYENKITAGDTGSDS